VLAITIPMIAGHGDREVATSDPDTAVGLPTDYLTPARL
jgi:hypothetical protein